jgi:putative oxidoreductase
MTAIPRADYSEPMPRSAAPPLAYLAIVGRALMSVIFLVSGFGKLSNLSGMAAAVHLSPGLLAVAGMVEVVGGGMILLGVFPRIGALGLFLFLIPTTLMFHNFWAAPAEHRMDQQVNFLKNLAIMGGLLMIVVYGSGPFSIWSGRRSRTVA